MKSKQEQQKDKERLSRISDLSEKLPPAKVQSIYTDVVKEMMEAQPAMKKFMKTQNQELLNDDSVSKS